MRDYCAKEAKFDEHIGNIRLESLRNVGTAGANSILATDALAQGVAIGYPRLVYISSPGAPNLTRGEKKCESKFYSSVGKGQWRKSLDLPARSWLR